MSRVGHIVSALGISAAVLGAGATAAYVYLNNEIYKESVQQEQNDLIDLPDNNSAEEVSVNDGLDSTAIFTYELYNEMTDTTDTITGDCPFELMGKTLADVKEYYPDWQVMAFSSNDVLLRKNVGSSNDDRYVVGVYENRVAVFYENSEEGIYMLTDTPVSSLEPDKQSMLNEGIYVEGKERLNRILEDYSS